jgi:hypothetical protein
VPQRGVPPLDWPFADAILAVFASIAKQERVRVRFGINCFPAAGSGLSFASRKQKSLQACPVHPSPQSSQLTRMSGSIDPLQKAPGSQPPGAFLFHPRINLAGPHSVLVNRVVPHSGTGFRGSPTNPGSPYRPFFSPYQPLLLTVGKDGLCDVVHLSRLAFGNWASNSRSDEQPKAGRRVLTTMICYMLFVGDPCRFGALL